MAVDSIPCTHLHVRCTRAARGPSVRVDEPAKARKVRTGVSFDCSFAGLGLLRHGEDLKDTVGVAEPVGVLPRQTASLPIATVQLKNTSDVKSHGRTEGPRVGSCSRRACGGANEIKGRARPVAILPLATYLVE